MVMTLTAAESGCIHYVKRPGAALDPGCVIAKLQLDDPSRVQQVGSDRREPLGLGLVLVFIVANYDCSCVLNRLHGRVFIMLRLLCNSFISEEDIMEVEVLRFLCQV